MMFSKSKQKSQKRRLPPMIWGFPVSEDMQVKHRDGTKTWIKGADKKGIALIIAIMIISVMMMLTTDLIVSSQVNLQLAVGQRDNLKTEYLAKSAFNIATMLLSADFAYDIFQTKSGGKLSDTSGDFWSAMNGMPIGGETLEMMGAFQEQFELSKVMDSGVMDQLKLFDGTFTLDVSDEQQKININDCLTGLCTETLSMIESLFSCPAEKLFLERKKINGHELALRFKDWIDKNLTVTEGSGDENEAYSRRTPQVHAKNAQFDSIDELRMIEGWDNEMEDIFAPYLTVFPYSTGIQGEKPHKVNINTASKALLGCLVPGSMTGDCAEKSAAAFKARNDDKAGLGGAGQSIADVLRDSLCYTTDEASKAESKNPSNWFEQRSSTFRIEATGSIGDRERKLVSVVERVMPDPQKNEKASYKILYWRLY